jgi:alkyldihydroxyacetonephosphate synthase
MTITSGAIPPRDMDPAAWGDPGRRASLPPHARRWLAKEIGLPDRRTPATPMTGLSLPESRIDESVRSALVEVVGEAHFRDDRDTLLRHAGGKSYLDLARRRRGLADVPDAVLLPADHAGVLAVLRICAERGVAVVPFGGGTSVVGGLSPLTGEHPAVISLDLRRLADPVHVDAESLTVTVGPGIRGPELERKLAAHGLTLGHFPQSWEHASLGGYAATRSSGQASSGYGRFDELVVALQLATPRGSMTIGRGPASAAGPDLKALILGSEGVFGVITELTLRVRRLPETVHDEGWSFRTFAEGMTALRRLAQAGLAPDIARLSDADETRANLALAGGNKTRLLKGMLAARGHRGSCLLIAGWEGPHLVVRDRRSAATALLRAAGGIRLGATVGEAWRRHRYDGPYLRDELLDHGALVETLETATSWTDLLGLYDTIRSALRSELSRDGARPLVMTHVSHLYPTGASLYFTALASRDDEDPDGQWQRAKERVSDVITSAGATITHHHAVGTDHRPWLEDEIGGLGIEVLRAVKSVLDPSGVLNPGKLIPEPPK